jgi:protein-arginine kinase activator protein McsA|tara:strand:- start:220 stop:390 length:171 start_codon:yes stop_codon:yes gene_type:complete
MGWMICGVCKDKEAVTLTHKEVGKHYTWETIFICEHCKIDLDREKAKFKKKEITNG